MTQSNMEVVAWRWKMLQDRTWTYDPAVWFVDKHKSDASMLFEPLVTLTYAQSEIERLTKARDALRGALKPFAEAAVDLDDDHKDGSDIWEASAAISITAGHLRAARYALQPLEPKND